MNRLKVRRIVNILIAVTVFLSWLAMALFGQGSLAENGLGNLKYFTVLSNLMEGIAAIVWLVKCSGDNGVSEGIERLKYIAASSVGLTCVVVMGFLGPLYGYAAMLKSANLFFHLIIPLMAMAEVLFLSDASYTRRDNNLTVIPPLIYGAGYLINIWINGIGEWPDTNDWYLFLHWGYPVGILIFAAICAITWLLGLLIRKLQRKL